MTFSLPAISYALDGASKATGIGSTNIKIAADRGDLICHWVGNKRIFRAADLDAWVQSLPTERPTK
ncbi:hypothetical protein [Pimelobacter simplex]|uniref:hypothetical protein n=1 Tax=Nocardioides simplex TaxID=2045 RepID=UPI00193317CB|nr:hypothetical protein [Pimelobacter simplex]